MKLISTLKTLIVEEYSDSNSSVHLLYYIFERSHIDRPSTWMGLTISGPNSYQKMIPVLYK